MVDGGGLESASAAAAGAPGRVAQPDGAGSPHAQPAKHVESHALAAASQLTACPAQEQSQASNPQDSPQASQPSAHSQGACPPPQPTIASAATFARAGCLTARAFTDFRGRPQPPTHRCSASQALSGCSSFTTSPKTTARPSRIAASGRTATATALRGVRQLGRRHSRPLLHLRRAAGRASPLPRGTLHRGGCVGRLQEVPRAHLHRRLPQQGALRLAPLARTLSSGRPPARPLPAGLQGPHAHGKGRHALPCGA